MKSWFVISLMLLAFSGCGEKARENPEKIPVAPSSVFMETEYHFCGAPVADRFLMGFEGENAGENDIHFVIVCHTGDTLFQVAWNSDRLIADSLVGAVDTHTFEALIRDRMRNMLVNNPPKKAMDTIPGYGPVPFELKSKMDSMGIVRVFTFRLGDGKPGMIAWSDDLKKAFEL